MFIEDYCGIESLDDNNYLAVNKGFKKFTIDNAMFDFVDGLYRGHMQEINVLDPLLLEYSSNHQGIPIMSKEQMSAYTMKIGQKCR